MPVQDVPTTGAVTEYFRTRSLNEWQSDVTYNQYDAIVYEGIPYRSLQDSNLDNTPVVGEEVNETWWQVVGGGGGKGSTIVEYKANDSVTKHQVISVDSTGRAIVGDKTDIDKARVIGLSVEDYTLAANYVDSENTLSADSDNPQYWYSLNRHPILIEGYGSAQNNIKFLSLSDPTDISTATLDDTLSGRKFLYAVSKNDKYILTKDSSDNYEVRTNSNEDDYIYDDLVGTFDPQSTSSGYYRFSDHVETRFLEITPTVGFRVFQITDSGATTVDTISVSPYDGGGTYAYSIAEFADQQRVIFIDTSQDIYIYKYDTDTGEYADDTSSFTLDTINTFNARKVFFLSETELVVVGSGNNIRTYSYDPDTLTFSQMESNNDGDTTDASGSIHVDYVLRRVYNAQNVYKINDDLSIDHLQALGTDINATQGISERFFYDATQIIFRNSSEDLASFEDKDTGFEVQKIGQLDDPYELASITPGSDLFLGNDGDIITDTNDIEEGEARVFLGTMGRNNIIDLLIMEPEINDYDPTTKDGVPVGGILPLLNGQLPDDGYVEVTSGSQLAAADYPQLAEKHPDWLDGTGTIITIPDQDSGIRRDDFPSDPEIGWEVWRTDIEAWFKYNGEFWVEI